MEQNKEYSDEELRQMAPTLFSIPKRNNFICPNDYFDNFKSDVMSSVVSNEFATPNTSDFKVPENYFENLKKEVMKETAHESKPKRSFNKSFLWAASIAAAIAIIFTLFPKEEECETFACLLENTTFSEDEMLLLLDSDETLEDYIDINEIELYDTQVFDEDIYEYMLDSDENLDDFLENYEL